MNNDILSHQQAIRNKIANQFEKSELDGNIGKELDNVIEKALRDTSHLILKTITDKTGKKTHRWVNKDNHDQHDIHIDTKVKYEHKGMLHHGTVKRVAKNGEYGIEDHKTGQLIHKEPHQLDVADGKGILEDVTSKVKPSDIKVNGEAIPEKKKDANDFKAAGELEDRDGLNDYVDTLVNAGEYYHKDHEGKTHNIEDLLYNEKNGIITKYFKKNKLSSDSPIDESIYHELTIGQVKELRSLLESQFIKDTEEVEDTPYSTATQAEKDNKDQPVKILKPDPNFDYDKAEWKDNGFVKQQDYKLPDGKTGSYMGRANGQDGVGMFWVDKRAQYYPYADFKQKLSSTQEDLINSLPKDKMTLEVPVGSGKGMKPVDNIWDHLQGKSFRVKKGNHVGKAAKYVGAAPANGYGVFKVDGKDEYIQYDDLKEDKVEGGSKTDNAMKNKYKALPERDKLEVGGVTHKMEMIKHNGSYGEQPTYSIKLTNPVTGEISVLPNAVKFSTGYDQGTNRSEMKYYPSVAGYGSSNGGGYSAPQRPFLSHREREHLAEQFKDTDKITAFSAKTKNDDIKNSIEIRNNK